MVENIFNTADNFTANSFPGEGEQNFNTVYSASNGNYRKVSCLGEHNTQETSPPWVNKQGIVTTEFAGNRTSRVLYSIKNATAELKL